MPRRSHELPTPRTAGVQRQKVLGLLREADGPVDVRVVADALRVHVTTARFHLTALEEQGYIRRGSARSERAGRPRLTYELAPKLDYAEIVSLFAMHLGGTQQEREQRARLIGADLAHRVRLVGPRPETSVGDLVAGTLAELGFQVRSLLTSFGEVTVQLCTCPLAEVAATAPEVVRGIQQGLIREVIDRNAESLGGSYSVAVTPDSVGGACEVGMVLRPVTS